jgi:hypothetical protein
VRGTLVGFKDSDSRISHFPVFLGPRYLIERSSLSGYCHVMRGHVSRFFLTDP